MKYRIVQNLFLFYLFIVVNCCDVNFPLGLIKLTNQSINKRARGILYLNRFLVLVGHL